MYFVNIAVNNTCFYRYAVVLLGAELCEQTSERFRSKDVSFPEVRYGAIQQVAGEDRPSASSW